MVNVRKISVEIFKSIGFKTKLEGLNYLKSNNIKSNKKQGENDFVNIVREKYKKSLEEMTLRIINSISTELNNAINTDSEIVINTAIDRNTLNNVINKVDTQNKKVLFKITYFNGSDYKYRSYVWNNRDRMLNMTNTLQHGSDTQDQIENDEIIEIKLEFATKEGYEKSTGAFFKWYNKTVIDLSRYGIFKNKTEANYTDSCFIHALKMSNVFTDKQLEDMILSIQRREVSLTTVNMISDRFNVSFKIYRYMSDKATSYKIGKHDITIELGLFENHWFIYENVPYTKGFINNYNNCVEHSKAKKKDISNYFQITQYNKKQDTYYRRNTDNAECNSLSIIKAMKDNDLFETIPLEDILNVPYYNKFKDDVIILPKQVNKNDYRLKVENNTYKGFDLNRIYNLPKLDGNKKIAEKRAKIMNEWNEHIKNDVSEEIGEISRKIYEQSLFKYKYVCFADYETITTKVDKTALYKHVPFILSFITKNIKTGEVICEETLKPDNVEHIQEYETDLAIKFLDLIPNNTIVYFHNLKYDKCFLFDHLTYIKKYVEKDGQLYAIECEHNNKHIVFRDSLKMVPMALSQFAKSFDLEVEKEIMPYQFYNGKNIVKIMQNKQFKTEKARQYCEDYDLFRNKVGDKFNPLEYSIYYCKRDVQVLMEGFEKFRQLCLEALEIDIYEKLTISTVAECYFIQRGAYNNIYELRGISQLFIQQSVYGGRVMVSRNQPKQVNKNMQDLDGVSLYPSAIYFSRGWAVGVPSNIDNNKNFNINQDALYYIEIELTEDYYARGKGPIIGNILATGEPRYKYDYDFPLFADKIDETIEYTNFPKNRRFTVNNIILKDLIKFYDLVENVHFVVLQGLEFRGVDNNGKIEKYNVECCNVVHDLFEQRKKYKKQNNPLQIVMKQILNATYGKTITKNNDKKVMIFNKDSSSDLNKFIYKNYSNICEIIHTNNHSIVKVYKEFNKHYNCVHIGSDVLGHSKMIMNKVFYELHNKMCSVYYQDTDSLHLLEEEVKYLPSDLIGKELGQFHCDFEDYWHINSIPIDKTIKYEGEPIYSEQAIFSGKKCYIHILRHRQSNVKYEHMRFKGCNMEDFKNTCKENNLTHLEAYEKIMRGEQFDIKTKKIAFDFTSAASVCNRLESVKSINKKNK